MEKVWQYSLADGWSEIDDPAAGDSDWHQNLRAAGYEQQFGSRQSYVLHVVTWWKRSGPPSLPPFLVYLDDDMGWEGVAYCKDQPSFMEILGRYSAIAANFAVVGKREDEVDREADRAVTKAADDKRRGR